MAIERRLRWRNTEDTNDMTVFVIMPDEGRVVLLWLLVFIVGLHGFGITMETHLLYMSVRDFYRFV